MRTVDGQKELCKYFVGLQDVDKETIRGFCSNHKIKRSTFCDSLQKYKLLRDRGIDRFHEFRGRPHLLDSQGYSSLISNLIEKKREQKSVSTFTFGGNIRDEIRSSFARRGIAEEKFKVSRNTVSTIMSEINASVVEAQKKTHARIFAEADPRSK